MLPGSEKGQLCGIGGLFHPQNKEVEGEKSEKAAPKGPSSALMAEKRKFMAVPDTQWSSKERLKPTRLLMLLGCIIHLVSLHWTKDKHLHDSSSWAASCSKKRHIFY